MVVLYWSWLRTVVSVERPVVLAFVLVGAGKDDEMRLVVGRVPFAVRGAHPQAEADRDGGRVR